MRPWACDDVLRSKCRRETAEEMAANAAEREEGKEKQGYLKIVEILKDHLKSHAWL